MTSARCWCAASTVSSSVRLRRALALAAACGAVVEEEAVARTSPTAEEETDGAAVGAADATLEESAAKTAMTAVTKRKAVQDTAATSVAPMTQHMCYTMLLKAKLRDWIS